jgi:hypothetical protein
MYTCRDEKLRKAILELVGVMEDSQKPRAERCDEANVPRVVSFSCIEDDFHDTMMFQVSADGKDTLPVSGKVISWREERKLMHEVEPDDLLAQRVGAEKMDGVSTVVEKLQLGGNVDGVRISQLNQGDGLLGS